MSAGHWGNMSGLPEASVVWCAALRCAVRYGTGVPCSSNVERSLSPASQQTSVLHCCTCHSSCTRRPPAKLQPPHPPPPAKLKPPTHPTRPTTACLNHLAPAHPYPIPHIPPHPQPHRTAPLTSAPDGASSSASLSRAPTAGTSWATLRWHTWTLHMRCSCRGKRPGRVAKINILLNFVCSAGNNCELSSSS